LAKTSKELEKVQSTEQATGAKLKSQRAQLEEQRRTAHSQQSRNTLLAALMEAQVNGKLNGILGRLGDLGTIAPEYDVAITTACPQLNYIVAESSKAAQMAVTLLKKNKLGVATFLMLDSINVDPRNMSPVETPEGVPRLFDLVQPRDENIRPAFYKALNETLVASDLDQASRIAYANKKRRRVVTLTGQMIEAAGTMSGGGDRAKRGGMSAKEVMPASDLANLEQEVSAAQQEIGTLRDSQRTLHKDHKALQAEISDLEFELKRAEMESLEVKKQVRSIDKHIKQLQSQGTGPCEEDELRQKELSETVQEYKSCLEEKESAAAPLQETIAQLKAEMMAVGGNKVEKQRTKVAALEGKVDELNQELSKLHVQITSAKKQLKTAEKGIASKMEDFEATTKAIASAEEEIKSIEDGAFEVLQAYKEAEKALAEKHKEVTAIEKEYEEKKACLDTIRSSEVDITNQLDDCKRVVKENQKKADQFTSQLRKLRKESNQDAFLPTDLESVRGQSEAEAPAADEAEAEAPAADEAEAPAADEADADADNEAPVSNQQDHAQNSKALILSSLSDDLSDEQLSGFAMDDMEHQIVVVTETLQTMKPNMGAIEEYRRKERDYKERMGELDVVTETRDAAKATLEGLRKQRLDAFMSGFAVISMKLKEMYQMITMGGDAELELVDSLDPFSEGIVFSVRPPKKSWKNITNLSGGEKTLSSLALVFALHHYKPTPLYVMDEIDAALDFKNVSIVANYVKDRTKNAQFIIISLRNNMFELANRLVGIYKTHDATKSITINPGSFAIGENATASA